MGSGAMELDADSVAAAPDSVGSTARMLRKQRLNLDSILDNSVSSAGEFFSKAVMSFGNHNNHSNQTPCNEAICGSSGSSFNEDQLDFGELARKMPAEYVDWPQGLRPNYGCLEQNKGPTVSTRAFDVNYKKYDDLEWQNNEEEQAQRAQWVNDKQDLAVYGKQAALTWDGRPWSETVEERQQLQMMQMMRSRSPFGKRRPFVSAEKKDPCKVCPNSNNSWTYSDTTWVEVGDVNNNYPNYEMYDRPAPPPQQQRAAQAAPIPCCEDDYAPCIYAPPAAQEHLLARPRQPEPVQQQRNYSSSYGQMGMGNSQESAYFGSTGGSYGYMRYEEQPQPEVVIKREPTPPPVPRIYKVGAINVGYKVENNDDYAENINRDLGHDESMGFPGGVQFNDLSSYGRAFAFPTSQVMEPPPVEPRHKPMERERSHKPRDTRERSFAPRETKKSSSYSHKTYDDTEERKPWAAQNKSLTDVRQKNEESRRRGNNKTSEKKPRRSASQGREASYVHRPSAGGDHVRSAKPQTWEERSFKPERKHYRKDEKKNVEQTANDGKTNSGFGRKIGRIFRLCD